MRLAASLPGLRLASPRSAGAPAGPSDSPASLSSGGSGGSGGSAGAAGRGGSSASGGSGASGGGGARSPGGRSPGGQAALEKAFAALGGAGSPIYYAYPSFVCFLAGDPGCAGAGDGELGDRLHATARSLLDCAGEAVFLADGQAFTQAALRAEFPELDVFALRLEEAFLESPAVPGVWIETARFAALRGLSAMRRELRRSGAAAGRDALALVARLLGLVGAPPA